MYICNLLVYHLRNSDYNRKEVEKSMPEHKLDRDGNEEGNIFDFPCNFENGSVIQNYHRKFSDISRFYFKNTLNAGLQPVKIPAVSTRGCFCLGCKFRFLCQRILDENVPDYYSDNFFRQMTNSV